MLTMPAMPAASKRAEVVDDFNRLDVRRRHVSSPRCVRIRRGSTCRPSIRMATLSLPRSETLPSWSTVTPGTFFNASRTVPVDCAGPRRGENLGVEALSPDRVRRHRQLFFDPFQARKPDVTEIVGLIECADDQIRVGGVVPDKQAEPCRRLEEGLAPRTGRSPRSARQTTACPRQRPPYD